VLDQQRIKVPESRGDTLAKGSGGTVMTKTDARPSGPTLGAHLAQLRKATGLSLRQVEEKTKKDVSNAYLSQLENDKIAKPSPNILEALADIYKTSYTDLMRRAGYLAEDKDASGRRRAKVATFAVQGLTPDEEEALIEYLAFIRKKRK
jgi:HTH-type transcriptional regulator, competence development regulator